MTGTDAGYQPPERTPFGRTETRYHNNRSPREAGLVPDDVPLGSAAVHYSYLSGKVFDKTDYDADGAAMQRDYSLYEVRTEYEPMDAPGTRVALNGERPALTDPRCE